MSTYLEPGFRAGHINLTVKSFKAALKARVFGDVPVTIAVRGVSGLLIGPILAYETGLKLVVVRKEGDGCHSSYKVEHSGSAKMVDYVIVDDLICTGDTVEAIATAVRSEWVQPQCRGVFLWNHGSSSCNVARFAPDNAPLVSVTEEAPYYKVDRHVPVERSDLSSIKF